MSKEEISEDFLRQYEQDIETARMQGAQQGMPYSAAMFGGQVKQNLVEWQLDFKPELEDIERLLRCDIIVRDKNNNEVWITNPDPNFILFNTIGVNDIIREIRMFLNKNKVLSNYSITEIKPRIRMLGHELRVLIYNNYEKYGMDNDYKQNNYSMVVFTIMCMVEDSYRRAINGGERRDLNSARMVTQQDSVQPANNFNIYSQSHNNQKRSKWYNPFSWGR